ncbi:hypothetical protein CTAYLR_008532 [Chrysophaeum taylorii]|uniref:Chlorophyll a-b binding protein, chloroplastic n=1 Tax=Chrysophaeum taylorii TaxID=2483200 RepID=A0AAD7U5W3_9STRA|nr:hypothetical protein CTAYLR_008532 [Chrysophaeum taylorii]
MIAWLALLPVARAFTAPAKATPSTHLNAAPLDDLPGASIEFNLMNEPWDPLGFASIHELIKDSPEHFGVWPSVQWLREAELKHCRVAMLAFVGAVAQQYWTFSGSLGGWYYQPGVNPMEALGSAFSTNPFGMWQLLCSIWLAESTFYPEGAWIGKMERAPGDLGWNLDNKKDDPEFQLKELKNGRLAMIGIISLSAAHFIPGSVPLIPSF